MKNKFFLCFRPIDVAEDSLVRNHGVDHHSSSRKKHYKENTTRKTKVKRRSSRKDKSISKASSSSSELSYSTSSLSSTTSSSSSSIEDDLSRSNSNSYEQKEAKNGSAECDKLVMNFSSFCLYFFVFILFCLIYIGRVYSIVATSLGLLVFSLFGRWKSENPMPQLPEILK
ncbi:PREDICTED: probable serine/threonine-protein kinase roco8 [Nicotiana attenuata]|uniref:Uncharacterized protein n=1 Tax=Nicotiana attenuata TaxID=49451 RepID=A0A314L452_NICAT|nr:PREDICTED: probable serine/threonine-protein kinase roco8 [Nicotiana attenuata]OIT36323.1 hypothetical protein A4A49_33662 [Nicotiana attenuata]